MKKMQLKTVTGGGYYPCKSQCLTDADCGGGSCVVAPDQNCHNRDGSIQSVGSCLA